MEAIIALLIVGWALRNVWEDVSGKRRASREKRIGEVAKKLPGAMTPARKRQIAAKHDAAWTTREVVTGFPVTRTAWHSAWLSHKTAAIQQRHQRELAKALHGEAHLGLAQKMAEHKARQAQIKAEIDQVIECEPEPPRTARAVRKAAGNVIHASFPRNDEPQGQPDPPARPEPGPYVPLSPADRHLAACSDPFCAACLAQIEANEQRRPPAGEWPAGVPHRRRNDTTPTAPSQGAPMPAGTTTEFTYDQLQSEATKTIIACDVREAELRAQQWAHMAEGLAGNLRDNSTLGNLADVIDADEAELKAVRAKREATQHFKDQLRRDHGGINEAVQSAPVPAAQPEFYEG